MRLQTLNNRQFYFAAGLLMLSFAFSSCKDSSSNSNGDSTYFMRFNVNGTSVEYTNQLLLIANFTQNEGRYFATLTGAEGISNVGLQLYDVKPIEETTYTAFALVNEEFVGLVMSYSDEGGTVFLQKANNSDVMVTLDEINDNNVRGTFSGTLEADGQPDVVISNGEFFLFRDL